MFAGKDGSITVQFEQSAFVTMICECMRDHDCINITATAIGFTLAVLCGILIVAFFKFGEPQIELSYCLDTGTDRVPLSREPWCQIHLDYTILNSAWIAQPLVTPQEARSQGDYPGKGG